MLSVTESAAAVAVAAAYLQAAVVADPVPMMIRGARMHLQCVHPSNRTLRQSDVTRHPSTSLVDPVLMCDMVSWDVDRMRNYNQYSQPVLIRCTTQPALMRPLAPTREDRQV